MQLPVWFNILVSSAFGLIVGSFLNVVIFRVPRNLSIVRPASRCIECSASIPWWGNIPLLSYLLLRGKCYSCSQPISLRYPVVEFITALLFVTDGLRFGWDPALLLFHDWPFLALLVAITFIDLEHRIIPDSMSIGGLVLGLCTFWLVPDFSLLETLGGAALGYLFFYLLAWTYERMRGKMGLGGGDIKLLAMIGAFLGPRGVIFTVAVSSLMGSVVGLLWASVLRKKDMMQFAIPYGPFLVVATLLYYFLGDLIWPLYMNPT